MAWAGAGDVTVAVADALKRDAAGLPAYVARQVAQAVAKAQGQIRGALYARGYTEAQLLAWDRLAEFHYDQSLFNAEVYLREAFKDAEGDLLKLKDRLGELATVAVTDAGGVVVVGALVGAGRFAVMTFRDQFDRAVARGIPPGPPWPGYW